MELVSKYPKWVNIMGDRNFLDFDAVINHLTFQSPVVNVPTTYFNGN
jgi:hypothetical protein